MTEDPEIKFYRKMFEPYSIRENFRKYDFKTFLKKDLERTISDLVLRPLHECKSLLEKGFADYECCGMYNTNFYRPETIYDYYKNKSKTDKKFSKISAKVAYS